MTNNNQPNGRSTWEKVVSLCLAAVVLIAFIFYVFNPPPTADATLALIRFLAATCAGLAAFLFTGDLNLQGKIPGLGDKVLVKAAGGFAAFLLVFFLFYFGIQPTEKSKPPSSQPVTLWGSYPTLALFNFEKPDVPELLVKELGIDKTPVIFRKSPVFDSIQSFISDTGNQNYISNIQQRYNEKIPLKYVVNQGNQTKTGRSQDTRVNLDEEIAQTQKQFEEDSLLRYGVVTKYNSTLTDFSTEPEEARWTAVQIAENTQDSYIIQYPKLSDIGRSTLTPNNFNFFTVSSEYRSEVDETWIKKVIDANPQQRGVVGYKYKYISKLSQKDLLPNSCDIEGNVSPDLLQPYVKFIDIWNTNNEAIQLKNVTYKLAFQKENPYKLRDSTQRSSLLKDASIKTDNLNFTLQPRRHFLIPIEFGFQFNKERKPSIGKLPSDILYLPKPLTTGGANITASKNKRVQDYKEPQAYNKAITQKIRLNNDFLSKIKYSKNEIEIPHKLAIGAVLNVESLEIDNRKVFVPKPENEFSSSITENIGFGCCPFLLVFNSSKGYWTELGTVLSGRDSENLQDTEIHGLNNPISKIKLQEREDEVTYLDYFAVRYTEPTTGISREVIPEIPSIKASDGKYLMLSKGESLEIDLNNLVPDNAVDLKLKVNGYYKRI